jgi:predicted methyltransferase
VNRDVVIDEVKRAGFRLAADLRAFADRHWLDATMRLSVAGFDFNGVPPYD